MKKEKLTAYDNFIINKRKCELPSNTVDLELFNLNANTNYNNTTTDLPNNGLNENQDNVLSTQEALIEKDKQSIISEASADDAAAKLAVKNLQFKKFGKLFLIGYVIIMIALALIVLVKTIVAENLNSAGAASIDQEKKEEGIQVMEDEDTSSNNNWFDNFCDSLK